MYNTYQRCRGTSLLPAHMDTRRYAGKMYAIDPRSPLSARDFVELLTKQNSVRSLSRIAAKMGLRFKTSKAETKALICDALTARKIAEPVLIGGVEARKTKSSNMGPVNAGSINGRSVNAGSVNAQPMNVGSVNGNVRPMNSEFANRNIIPSFQPRFPSFSPGNSESSGIGIVRPRFQPFRLSSGSSGGVQPRPMLPYWSSGSNNRSLNNSRNNRSLDSSLNNKSLNNSRNNRSLDSSLNNKSLNNSRNNRSLNSRNNRSLNTRNNTPNSNKLNALIARLNRAAGKI
jgi:hypothetical protein